MKLLVVFGFVIVGYYYIQCEKLNVGRIVEGLPAEVGQFPSEVLISIETGPNVFYCGGSLISSEWVITAGHCIFGGTAFSVRLGSLYSVATNDTHLQVINSSLSILHPNFNETGLQYDIGLIKLSHPAKLNDYVKPIELDSNYISEGTNLTTAGWGKTADNDTFLSPILRYTTLKIISNDECAYYFPRKDYNYSVCAVGETIESTCSGDSGNGLIKYTNGIPVHTGIVSWGAAIIIEGQLKPACEYGFPQGFMRTSYFREWIENQTGSN